MKSIVIFLVFASLACSLTIRKRNPFEIKTYIGDRIIGGDPAEETEFPYVAAIWTTTSLGRYFCGGSVIDRQWILTAGHCVIDAQSFRIQLGSISLSASDDNRDNLTATVSVVHPEFDSEALTNNLGLIYLDEPLRYNDYINFISLPTVPLSENVLLTTSGWGQIDDQNSGPVDALQKVIVVSLLNEHCRNYYGEQIIDSMVCAAGSFNEGTCIGDIGGPLVDTSGAEPILVGVASFLSGNGCESSDPSGYERTYSYLDWIRSVTNIE